MQANRNALYRVRRLAKEAGLSYGELLRMAREAEHECALPALELLSGNGAERLASDLIRLLEEPKMIRDYFFHERAWKFPIRPMQNHLPN